jgi:hypothetical protein
VKAVTKQQAVQEYDNSKTPSSYHARLHASNDLIHIPGRNENLSIETGIGKVHWYPCKTIRPIPPAIWQVP